MVEEPRRGPPVVEIVLPTYITKPTEDEKFYPSEVKAIAEKAVRGELQDKGYDGEDAKEWSLNIADAIRDGVKTLKIPRHKTFVEVTLAPTGRYVPTNQAEQVPIHCAHENNAYVRDCVLDSASIRYKIVVQVTIGQMKHQGVRVASRCLWDTATDNYASVQFRNQSLWCSAMIFGVYTE